MGTTLVLSVALLALVSLVIFQRKTGRGHYAELPPMVALVIAFLLGLRFFNAATTTAIAAAAAGVIVLAEKWVWSKRRSSDVAAAPAVEVARQMFPYLAVIFLFRALVMEQFVIPSSSMRPGLVVDDQILVNKMAYGVRLPFVNWLLVPTGQVQRHDVVVFAYPEDEAKTYIKRVVGVPGDVISYHNKVLSINGQAAQRTPAGAYVYAEARVQAVSARVQERFGSKEYATLVNSERPVYYPSEVRKFPLRSHCQYAPTGFTCKVPQGHYFMMGDNRDNSEDSRYWGFVSEEQVQGKAFMIWANWRDRSRIGMAIR